MASLTAHLYEQKIKLSTTKTVSAVFHLYNKDTTLDLSIFINGLTLPFCAEQIYLSIKLNWTLTFRRHLESLLKKLLSRIRFLKQLTGSSWNAEATILRTVTLALVDSTAEYCAPVWCCSAHTRIIDKPINDVLRIVTRCLRPTPTDNLFILTGIQPTELCL